MENVAILLTTYNSERFLDELLQSLLRQTYTHWTLYVRDDFSSDHTSDILRRYQAEDSRIHLLEDGCKRGAMNGFLWLLQRVEAEYYMFCDHDDVWKEDKIALTLGKMCKVPDRDEIPLVVHTDLTVTDERLQVKEPSFWQSQHFRREEFGDKYFHLVYNNVTGCTMMLNRKAKEVSLPPHPCARMHDFWISAAVLWHGGQILSVDEPTLYYRQHGDNTIGMNALPSFANKLLRVKAITNKVMLQAQVARFLSGMGLARFLILKVRYMLQIYKRDKSDR